MNNPFTSRNFVKYFVIGVLMTIISTILLVIAVDYFGLWVGLANPLIVVFIFVLRYYLFDKAGMLSKEVHVGAGVHKCPHCGKDITNFVFNTLGDCLLEKTRGLEYDAWAEKYPHMAEWLRSEGFVYSREQDESLKKKEVVDDGKAN